VSTICQPQVSSPALNKVPTLSGAVLGRTVPPWLSDRVLGPLNATIAMNVFTLAVVLVLWLPLGASSVTALFVVVVLMGIGTGSFVPLGGKCPPLLQARGSVLICSPKSRALMRSAGQKTRGHGSVPRTVSSRLRKSVPD
jgi:hypothetical protein